MEEAPTGVAVVTDSTPYVPPELLAHWGVAQVSLYVGWDGDLRPEREYTDLDAFYARLRDSPGLPSTSQPSVGDFKAVYEPLVAAGRDVASIHLAEGLSGTCASAREAGRLLAEAGHPGRVEVLDAATGAGGLGLLVLAAAGARSRTCSRPRERPARAWTSGSASTRSSTCAAAGASAPPRRCSAPPCRSSRC
jgi:DegV family protein with EDD domain